MIDAGFEGKDPVQERSEATAFDEAEYVEVPELLNQIVIRTNEMGFAMASEPRTGALLRTLAASKPGGRLLELGTGTGIATAWLLSGMSATSTLTSVDIDAKFQGVAREFLGHDVRLRLVLEEGLVFLAHQEPEAYDLVFADALPGKYDGLAECLRVVKRGGFYVIDDMLPQANWPEGHAAKIAPLIRSLSERHDFSIAPLGWSSGIIVAVRR